MDKNQRILCVDPGQKRIGLAISDQTATIASPLMVINHVQRKKDAEKIVELAEQIQVIRIIVGQALTVEGDPSPSGRQAARLAEIISEITEIPVELWDETGSTKEAQAAMYLMGGSQKNRRSHLDDLAATVILQSYLDANYGLYHPITDK